MNLKTHPYPHNALSSVQESKTVRKALNHGAEAMLETANAIPGVSLFSGVATLAYGAFKLSKGVIESFTGTPDVPRDICSGLVSMALGLMAVFLPVLGNIVNGLFAAKDGMQASVALHALIQRTA